MSSEKLLNTATLATLIIVTIGVTFAAFQVCQEALTRHLQTISALWAEIWPPEASQAYARRQHVPAGCNDAAMTDELFVAIRTAGRHYT